MQAVSQSDVARECGVSRMAVSKAVAAGRIPIIKIKGQNRIDLHDPQVQFVMGELKERAGGKGSRRSVGVCESTVAEVVEVETVERKAPPPDVEPPSDDPDAPWNVKARKAAADAALAEVKLKTAAEGYFEKVGAVVDTETLRRKMAVLEDTLFTHLVYMAEDIADTLWLEARASDDPPRKIRETLAKRVATILEKVKDATAEILPPERGRKYVIIDEEDE